VAPATVASSRDSTAGKNRAGIVLADDNADMREHRAPVGGVMGRRNSRRRKCRAVLPLLFNPFARSEKPTSSACGLGLGLYNSERIIDAHGGKLSVQSSADEGTTVKVALPLRS
jgi:hypothetical protein